MKIGKVNPHTRQVLSDLLTWDRDRIMALERKHGVSLADYRDKQDRAEALLDRPIEGWPPDLRELWQTLVETHGQMATGGDRVVFTRDGPQRVKSNPKSARDFRGLVNVADEIGVLPVLKGAGAKVWREA